VVLAWLVILALVAGIVVRNALAPRDFGEGSGGETLSSALLQVQGRYYVGAADLFPSTREQLARQVKSLDSGPPAQRLRLAIVMGELAGPTDAREQLNKIEVTPGSPEAAQRQLLNLLYENYEEDRFGAPSLDDQQREQLHQQLGWFGDLALASPGQPDSEARAAVLQPAHQTAVVLLVVGGAFLVLLVVGFTVLVLFVVLLFSGALRSGISANSHHGGIYAETFAVWLLLFLGLSFGSAWLPVHHQEVLLAGVASLLSLTALAWPVLRGTPWRQVRQDIGLTAGPYPVLEPLAGVGAYLMALPLVVVGALLMYLLLFIREALRSGHWPQHLQQEDMPSHPIVQVLVHGDGWVWLQILLVASVLAPLVEETMFRGVLYRHLRDLTGRWGRLASILLSALWVSFIFAVIHPQGWAGVPVLMGLAFSFALVREWRGSLLPAMVAHGLNNTLALLLGTLLLHP
jgi:membrane protease YdiL (CAAX protease family)